MDIFPDIISVLCDTSGVWECFDHDLKQNIRCTSTFRGKPMSNDCKVITITGTILVGVELDGLLCAGLVKFENHKVEGGGIGRIVVVGMLDCLYDISHFTIVVVEVECPDAHCFGCKWDVAVGGRENKVIMDEASSTSHPVDKKRVLVRLCFVSANNLCAKVWSLDRLLDTPDVVGFLGSRFAGVWFVGATIVGGVVLDGSPGGDNLVPLCQ
mmetsp:Transcript_3652/g.8141  ORF Transcript_3652/g.8141 Transcript_3652/m.8141 type:complete len:212 (-) Transcript_3652:323-958(-)